MRAPPPAWSPDGAAISWIEAAAGPGARVARVEPMPPSATAKHRIDVVTAEGATLRLVLRRYHDAARLATDPWYLPAHEAAALGLLAGTGVPAPRLLAADLEAAVCDSPALLESWIAGEPAWRPRDLPRYLARAAEVLVAVHAVASPAVGRLPLYAPYRGGAPIVPPPFTTRPGLWERVAEVLRGPWPACREGFLHRDYHPGNTLWDGARLTGVVDWATAARGPRGIDLARMRLNLAIHAGTSAADTFLARYVEAGGDAAHRDPYWDLLDAADALDPAAPPADAEGFARFEGFVATALAELGRAD